MAKFTEEQKLKAVQSYLLGKESYHGIAERIGIDHKSVIKWVALFKEHGMEGLKLRGYTIYSNEFKLDVLKYMIETGASLLDIAVKFNIPSPFTVLRWKNQLERVGIGALIQTKKGRLPLKQNNRNLDKKSLPNEVSVEKMQAEIERLRMENAYFKKVECLSSKQGKITKQDKAQVVYELRHEFPVKKLVELAGLPRSTYYFIIKNMNRPDPDMDLKEMIHTIYHEHEGRYGYRRIRDELVNRGQKVNCKKVRRIMNKLGLKSLVRLKKYRSYKGRVGKIAPNILERNFKADKPNEKWVTDITEFKLFGEKLYLSPVLDLFNGEIITYTIGPRPTYSLVSEMLEKAFSRLSEGDQLLMHSDQGWHYQMKQYSQALKERGITQSMSRKGNCYDNSVMENFFGILKSEFLYLKEFESIEHFKLELAKYIEYYNNKRIKAKLKGQSPIQYRTLSQQAA
ncbi:IS3 family transposase [Psychrobacillus sp. FJAT-51614]|uniref:IS3 family transposase n=1 Tax=Psychrobacillus mangrovi TaxID=3117745 RepID=A0ABU8F4P0_9BACI